MRDNTECIQKLDKLINRFILESRKFIEYTAFPYGTVDLLLSGEKNEKFVWDYEYFVFTMFSV
jgi:hypothetical protein